jgi:hypothetical protein
MAITLRCGQLLLIPPRDDRLVTRADLGRNRALYIDKSGGFAYPRAFGHKAAPHVAAIFVDSADPIRC